MDKTMDKLAACGIEVSARELVVALEGATGQVAVQRFAEHFGGAAAVATDAHARGSAREGLSGGHWSVWLDVALLLSGHAQLEVVVANPRAVRNFAQALMRRSKSDPQDAVVLWEFAQRMPCRRWVRPEPATLALWAIARRLQALTAQRTAEKNRQHAAGVSAALPQCVRDSLARSLRALEREIKKLRAAALACIAGVAKLRERYAQLRSVPGIGEVSAIQVLAEVQMLPEDRDVRQWVAYAGLDPREYRSGTSVRKTPRISKVG